MDRASRHTKVEMIDRANLTEKLHQAAGFDRREGVRHRVDPISPLEGAR
jgi:hypothetical protein